MFPDNWRRLSLTLATLVLCGCDGPPAPATRAGAITSLDTGRVAVADGALYYEAAGSGALVILLHGGNLDRRMWDINSPSSASTIASFGTTRAVSDA